MGNFHVAKLEVEIISACKELKHMRLIENHDNCSMLHATYACVIEAELLCAKSPPPPPPSFFCSNNCANGLIFHCGDTKKYSAIP